MPIMNQDILLRELDNPRSSDAVRTAYDDLITLIESWDTNFISTLHHAFAHLRSFGETTYTVKRRILAGAVTLPEATLRSDPWFDQVIKILATCRREQPSSYAAWLRSHAQILDICVYLERGFAPEDNRP